MTRLAALGYFSLERQFERESAEGGGAAGLAGSAPAFLLIHFFSSLSYTNEVSSPRLALIGLGVEESERLQNLPSQEPEEDAADAACCG